MLAFLEALVKVLFGIKTIVAPLFKAIFPDEADKAEEATKVIDVAQTVVQKLEEDYPESGLGSYKKAVAMGEATKAALEGAKNLSSGGQKAYLERTLKATSDFIDGVIQAAKEAQIVSDTSAGQPQQS